MHDIKIPCIGLVATDDEIRIAKLKRADQRWRPVNTWYITGRHIGSAICNSDLKFDTNGQETQVFIHFV